MYGRIDACFFYFIIIFFAMDKLLVNKVRARIDVMNLRDCVGFD